MVLTVPFEKDEGTSGMVADSFLGECVEPSGSSFFLPVVEPDTAPSVFSEEMELKLSTQLKSLLEEVDRSGSSLWRWFDVDGDGRSEALVFEGENISIVRDNGDGRGVTYEPMENRDGSGLFRIPSGLRPIGVTRNAKRFIHPSLRGQSEQYFLVCVAANEDQPVGMSKIGLLYRMQGSQCFSEPIPLEMSVSYSFPDDFPEEKAMQTTEFDIERITESQDLLYVGDQGDATVVIYKMKDSLRRGSPEVVIKTYVGRTTRRSTPTETQSFSIIGRSINVDEPDGEFEEEESYIPKDIPSRKP